MAETMESILEIMQAEERGGYWCSDGEHYTFGTFFDRTCCDNCMYAVQAYYDGIIW